MTKLIIVGAGALGANALHIARQTGAFEVVGFVDASGASEVLGLPVLGADADLPDLRVQAQAAVVCFGDSATRARVAADVRAAGYRTPALVSPKAEICVGASVEEGCIVFAHTYVGPFARIGAFSVLEASSVVGPKSSVGAYSTVAPLARIGAGSVVPDHAKISGVAPQP